MARTPSGGFYGEVASGERAEFGEKWRGFLEVLNEDRIVEAQSSLWDMLRRDDLADLTFLDIGSGSGFVSLAAARLDAQHVRFVAGRRRLYNPLPQSARLWFVLAVRVLWALTAAKFVVRDQPLEYVRRWTDHKSTRGMSRWRYLADWVGRYPFEVAKPEEILDLRRMRGFELQRIKTCAGRPGANPFILKRMARA